MSIRAKMIKQAAREQKTATRNLTRYIGNRMLRSIMNDISGLDSVSRPMVEASNLQKRLQYINPTYIYSKYADKFVTGTRAADGMTEFERGVRSSIYKHAKVFDAVKYASQKVSDNPLANSFMEAIFRPTVVNIVVFSASQRLFVYDEIRRKSGTRDFREIAERVYAEREKIVTGLSLEGLSIMKRNIKSGGGDDGIYFQMNSRFVSSGRDVSYYSELMDKGLFVKDDIPTIAQIYGWLKRREQVGKLRPLHVVGWRRRNKRVGSAARFLNHPPRDMLLKKPYEIAPVIASRFRRRYSKRGKMHPFGSFAKYSKGTVYKSTIFTTIFRQFLQKHIVGVYDAGPGIEERVYRTLKFRVSRAIESMKEGKPEAEKHLHFVNTYIRNKHLNYVMHDGRVVGVPSEFRSNQLRKLMNFARKLDLIK